MQDEDPSFAEGERSKRSPSGARRRSRARELEQAQCAALNFSEQPGNLITGPMLRQMTETWLASVALASVVASRDKASLVESAQEMGPEGLGSPGQGRRGRARRFPGGRGRAGDGAGAHHGAAGRAGGTGGRTKARASVGSPASGLGADLARRTASGPSTRSRQPAASGHGRFQERWFPV